MELVKFATMDQGLLKCRRKEKRKVSVGRRILPQSYLSVLSAAAGRVGAAGHLGLLEEENGGNDTTCGAPQGRQHWLRGGGLLGLQHVERPNRPPWKPNPQELVVLVLDLHWLTITAFRWAKARPHK